MFEPILEERLHVVLLMKYHSGAENIMDTVWALFLSLIMGADTLYRALLRGFIGRRQGNHGAS